MNKRIEKKKTNNSKSHMVNMRSRIQIKIVKSTPEEELELQRELDEIEIKVEEQMSLYEENLKRIVKSTTTRKVVNISKEDEDLISYYKEEYKTRNKDNIERRLNQALKFLKEQEN